MRMTAPRRWPRQASRLPRVARALPRRAWSWQETSGARPRLARKKKMKDRLERVGDSTLRTVSITCRGMAKRMTRCLPYPRRQGGGTCHRDCLWCGNELHGVGRQNDVGRRNDERREEGRPEWIYRRYAYPQESISHGHYQTNCGRQHGAVAAWRQCSGGH